MSDNENFGGTRLLGENGEQMDPAIAGIPAPGVPTMSNDAAGAALAADLEDDDAGNAEIKALTKKTAKPM